MWGVGRSCFGSLRPYHRYGKCLVGVARCHNWSASPHSIIRTSAKYGASREQKTQEKEDFVSGLEEPPLCSGGVRSNVTVHRAMRMQEALRDESSEEYQGRGGIPRMLATGFLGNSAHILPMDHRHLALSYTVSIGWLAHPKQL